jgi:hypothetical protein
VGGLLILTRSDEAPLTWGWAVSVMYVSVLRHDTVTPFWATGHPSPTSDRVVADEDTQVGQQVPLASAVSCTERLGHRASIRSIPRDTPLTESAPQLTVVTASSTVIVPAQGGSFADTRLASQLPHRWIEA